MKPRNELTEDQARRLLTTSARRPKYGNQRVDLETFFGRHRFDSKREARVYRRLAAIRKAGEYRILLLQVPFKLPGSTRYVADFLAVNQHGDVLVYDVKGVRTQTYKVKKRQVEEIYGVRIREI
jgi:Protein of unknown function (DUF1064)